MSVDKRQAHLELLRALVRRMSFGSLLLRGWGLLLVFALATVGADPVRERLTWLALAIAIAFWVLDGHLLRQKRLYTKAYERARVARDEQIDFSLNTSGVDDRRHDWASLVFSRALLLFHGSVIAAIVLIGHN